MTNDIFQLHVAYDSSLVEESVASAWVPPKLNMISGSLEVERSSDSFLVDLSEVLLTLGSITGFIAASVAYCDGGKTLATLCEHEGFDIDVASATHAKSIGSTLDSMAALGSDDEHIEDILITLKRQYHLIRPLEDDPSVFVYLALDKSEANLALARHCLLQAAQSLSS